MLGEFFADGVGGDADNGVLAGVEVGRELEQFDADGAFLEGVVGLGDGAIDDILQEVAAALTGAKGGAVQEVVQLLPYGGARVLR